jgi:uncharacterized protein
MRVPVLIAALASLLAWTSISHAASFDCAKATQPAERLICSDSDLSNLDEAMAAEYSRARAAVSEEGRKQLRDNQRNWLKYVSATCTKSRQALQCISDAYRDRHDSLKKVPVMRGPFTFIPVESFGFRKAPADDNGNDDGGLVSGWTITFQRYPQIDDPVTPEARGWNAYIAAENTTTGQSPATGEDDTEIDLQESFHIHSAAPALISMSNEGYVYPHGAAHGTEGAQTSNYLLPQARELTATDLFHPDRDWQTFLTTRCFTALAVQADSDQWTLDAASPAALTSTASDPQNWEITETALTIRFPVYEVGPYSASMPKVEIPWAELKPYLAERPALPVPPG